MKEAKFLGSLMPSHPDIVPIIVQLREKYNLPEIGNDDEPIDEIYLRDDPVSLDEFRNDILNQLQQSDILLTPDSKFYKPYMLGKELSQKQLTFTGTESMLSDEIKKSAEVLYALAQTISGFFVKIIDQQYTLIADMIYVYMLMGETQEAPNDWFSKVVTVDIDGEPVVFAMATQIADPEMIVQQFREEYRRKFGKRQPKITNAIVSTAHFLRLKRLKKPWNFIVEEFIRLNKFSLPRDRASKRYFEARSRYERQLRKRISRTERILDVLLKDPETKKS